MEWYNIGLSDEQQKFYKEVRGWIAQQMNASPTEFDNIYKKQSGILYLLIWPLLETEIFDSYMKGDQIAPTAKKFAPYYSELDCDSMCEHFFERYKDGGRWSGLTSNHVKDFDMFYTNIRLKGIDKSTEEEKIGFLIYIAYRYRNNIFHGTKEYSEWPNYTQQIEYCLRFMMKLIDCNNKHEIIVRE